MNTPTTPSFAILSVARAEESYRPSLKGRARVRIADVVLAEIEIISGKSGLFAAYPSRKETRGSSDTWCPLLEIVDRETERGIFRAAREAYLKHEARAKEAAAASPATEPPFPEPNGLPF